MNPNLALSVGLLAAIAAGFACIGAHWIAKRRRWHYVTRYVAGIGIALAALVFPFGAALSINDAVLAWGITALIFVGEGIATWLAHDADPNPPPSLTPQADAILSKLDEELDK